MKTTARTLKLGGPARLLGLRNLLALKRARRDAWDALLGPYITTRAIQALWHIGFLQELAGGKCVNAAAFARSNALDEAGVTALCEALYARHYFRKSLAGYSLARKGWFLSDNQLAMGWFELVFGYAPVLNGIEKLLRREAVYGAGIVRDGEAVATGSGMISTGVFFPLVMKTIAAAGYRKVLDIGCGDGAFLRFLCRQLPHVTGVGVDLSAAAVAAGRSLVEAAGLSSRIRLLVGDARALEPLGHELRDLDAITAFFVLHELCDAQESHQAVEFLRAVRRALPGVTLHIVEPIRVGVERLRKRPGLSVEYFLLHDLSRQHLGWRGDWARLFAKAGFEQMQEQHITFARTAIYSVK
ncbi:MAG: class I SAM-dependent methyltransferase [Bryobacteraceae bacterium]